MLKSLLLAGLLGLACGQAAPSRHVRGARPVSAPAVLHPAQQGPQKPDPFTERQNAWLDWNQGYLSYISDDTYANGLFPYWFGYGSDPEPAGSPMPTREKIGWATVSRSYQIASQNFENQIDRLYHADEFDHDAYESLNYNLDSANYNALAGALSFIDVGVDSADDWAWWLGYYYANEDTRLSLDLAYENKDSTYHEIINAENENRAAEYWNMGSMLTFLQSAGKLDNMNPNIPNYIIYAAAAQDDYNGRDAVYHAERAYYKNPSKETYHELELAEILAESAYNGALSALQDAADPFPNAMDGYFADWTLYNQYRLAAVASEYQTEHSARSYYDKYGNYPHHDNYGLSHRRHHDDYHY